MFSRAAMPCAVDMQVQATRCVTCVSTLSLSLHPLVQTISSASLCRCTDVSYRLLLRWLGDSEKSVLRRALRAGTPPLHLFSIHLCLGELSFGANTSNGSDDDALSIKLGA